MKSTDMDQARPIILSLRPRWSEAILRGEKTIEVRRRFREGENLNQRAVIYSSAPMQAIVGEMRIDAIRTVTLRGIIDTYLDATRVTQEELEAYLGDKGEGSLLFVSAARRYSRVLRIDDLRERHQFTPPQSFAYAKEALLRDIDG